MTPYDSTQNSGATNAEHASEVRRAGRIADEGVRLAHGGGLEAEPLAIKATGPVWKTIVETADRYNAAAIVMGSRGLTGVRSMLLGSVSSAVMHHADRPTLVVHRNAAG